jgi:hypothetical protein
LVSRNKKTLTATDAAQAKLIADKRKKAFELRMAGATLQDIVNAGIGYNSTAHVSIDLRKARSTFYQEDIESLLIMDLARIDEMQKYCTAALRMGDTGQVRNIMALMQFRRETMGITPEAIQERKTSASSITNNGIMVVQGSTRDYLAGVMEAAGASPDEIEQEFKELEPAVTSGKSGSHRIIQGKVIQGEVLPEVTPETGGVEQDINPDRTTSSSTSSNGKKKSKKFKVVRKSTAQPGPEQSSAMVSAMVGAMGDPVLLEQLVEKRAQQLDQDIENKTSMRLGRLDSPAVIPVELATQDLSVPVKLRDSNVPVSSGISYKTPPRKLTTEEATREVTRRLRHPTTVDRMRTRVQEEEI